MTIAAQQAVNDLVPKLRDFLDDHVADESVVTVALMSTVMNRIAAHCNSPEGAGAALVMLQNRLASDFPLIFAAQQCGVIPR